MERLYWEQQCCARHLYRFIYPKTKVCLCPWTRRKQLSLLVHPVRWRPSSNSRRIGRPATPSGMSASKPGRPRRRPPSIISRQRLQRKGPAFGSLSHFRRTEKPSTLLRIAQAKARSIAALLGLILTLVSITAFSSICSSSKLATMTPHSGLPALGFFMAIPVTRRSYGLRAGQSRSEPGRLPLVNWTQALRFSTRTIRAWRSCQELLKQIADLS